MTKRWHRVRTDDWAAECRGCTDVVMDFHEKQIGPHFVRLCPDCYQKRPSDKELIRD